jgi:insertion element IS1 protein InsB
MTAVERETRCIVSYAVACDREPPRLQALIDQAPQAKQYYSDDLAGYTNLVYYPGHHQALPDKRETYSVEADNAELRHYLARLARRSRCFTRALHALRTAIKLFVYAWNRRQLFRRAHPKYSAHVFDFVYP